MAVALDAILARIKDVCKRNGLLILSVLSVTIGCLLGFFLRTRRLSQQVSVAQQSISLQRKYRAYITKDTATGRTSGWTSEDKKHVYGFVKSVQFHLLIYTLPWVFSHILKRYVCKGLDSKSSINYNVTSVDDSSGCLS